MGSIYDKKKDRVDQAFEKEEEEEEEEEESFVQLTNGRQFSRLLYPNPVCFLCTPADQSIGYQEDNVMTISWLTAINNDGKFMLSMNRRRHSASYVEHVGREFCLCVPVAGMEAKVLAVGGTSGSVSSKFIDETSGTFSNHDTAVPCSSGVSDDSQNTIPVESAADNPPRLSKRQNKRLERSALRRGITGLKRRPFHSDSTYKKPQQSDMNETDCRSDGTNLFYIQGTVARMRCTIDKVYRDNEIDDDHNLVFGRVIDAYCHSDYWDEAKNLFCPRNGTTGIAKPFLTFFGSQTFGHVVMPNSSTRRNQHDG